MTNLKERKLHPDVVIGVLSLLFSLFIYIEIRSYPKDVKLFPSLFLFLFAIFMAFTLIQGIRKSLDPQSTDISEFWCKWNVTINPLLTGLFVVAYVAIIYFVGFYVATILYMTFAMYYFGSKNWKLNLGIAIVMVGFCYAMFEMALAVKLPLGIVFNSIL